MALRPEQRLTINGKEQRVLEVDFEIKREEWNDYALLDGGIVRLKTSPQHVYRILGEDGRPVVNADGTAAILVMHRTDVVTTL